MSTISIDKDLALDLFRTKLQIIDEKIQNILETWNYREIDAFIEDTKKGNIIESEMDAISLENLRNKRKQIEKLME
jgi:hypothetical protein